MYNQVEQSAEHPVRHAALREPEPGRRTLALALSGCSGRAVTYIGMLEALDEHHVPVDMIAACSSATLVATAYASGRLQLLKEHCMQLEAKQLFDLFEPSFKGGIFSLDGLEAQFSEFVSAENIEDLNVPLAIVASDISKGESIVFRMGNVMRAVKASCSHPGVFEPVVWGDKILIDGGLFEIVPVEAARESGADVVVGFDLSLRRNLFKDMAINLKQGYNFLMRPLIRPFTKLRLFGARQDVAELEYEDTHIDEIKVPNMMSILGKALDYAIEERKKGEHHHCDLMIEPDIKKFGKMDTENFKMMYEEGRRSMQEHIPEIKRLLNINN